MSKAAEKSNEKTYSGAYVKSEYATTSRTFAKVSKIVFLGTPKY